MAQGLLGRTLVSTSPGVRFSTLFSHRVLDVFLMVLASILDDFLDDFPMFVA